MIHVEISLPYILKDRESHLQETKNREMHLRYCAEAPIKPSEALMQIGGNIFPTDLLKQQKAFLLSHKDTYLNSSWIGTLAMDPETQKLYLAVVEKMKEEFVKAAMEATRSLIRFPKNEPGE